MDLAVADLLEQEEKKALERQAIKNGKARKTEEEEEDFIKFPPKGSMIDAFEAKYRRNSPPPSSRLPPPPPPPPGSGGRRGDLFGGRYGSANRYLKYEDENDLSGQRSRTGTPAGETPDRRSHKSRDDEDDKGASDGQSANGSARSSRCRSRSPSTGRHSRREREHYRSRHDDRYRDSPKHSRHSDSDRNYRSRRDTHGHDRNSYKGRAADDIDMTDAPDASSSRGRDDRSPREDRPTSSHHSGSGHYRRDDRRRDEPRYSGSRRDRDDYRRQDRYYDSRRDDRRDDRREPYGRKRTPDPSDEERDLRSVFCQQLAVRLQGKQLKEFFEANGCPVREVQLVKDRHSDRHKGVGYVEFKEHATIEKALKLTGHKLLGVPIIVNASDAEKNRQAKANAGASAANNNGQPYHRLYVGNIQFSITEEDITSLFENFGPLDFVQLQRDDLGRSKGYGFVQFTDPKDAQAALESMNGQMLNNRPMRVGLGTTDKLAQEANATLQQRQAAQTGSAFSGAGGRGGYSGGANKEDNNKGAGASALDDADVTGVSLNHVNRHELMRKLARLDDDKDKKTDSQPKAKPAMQKVDPTRCVCLANLWTAKATAQPGWQKEIEDDVRTECNEKYGIVKHVGIDPNSQQGEVYVKFDRVQGGENAYRGLNGRYFDEARINAKYVVDAVYNILFPKAANL